MLMIERQVRSTYAHVLGAETPMPKKGKHVVITGPLCPSGIAIFWTERKSPDGKRLYNCGANRPNGSEPPLFGS